MASVKKITMREYNGTDYDTLYPKTIASQVDGVYNKTEVDTLLANRITLLWENASPTSEFSAQTLSVNTDGCLGIIVSFVGSSADFSSPVGSDIVNMTIGTIKETIWQNSARIYYRPVKWKSTSEIAFYDAMGVLDYNNSSTRVAVNSEAIPYRIYGIKA